MTMVLGKEFEKLLDLLKEEKVPATFFLVGNNIDGNEEIIKRAYDEGHCIANHSYSHDYSRLYSGSGTVMEEYDKVEKKIKKILGNDFNNRLFRFPGGSVGGEFNYSKQRIAKKLNKKGIAHVDWNCLTNDAAGEYTKKGQIKMFNLTREGWHPLIILQHDKKTEDLIGTTKEIIKTLKKEKYEFKNFNELILVAKNIH